MTKIEVRCPTCSIKGNIEIDELTIKSISRGLLAVNVATSTICPHTFVAYVDRNLNVRDYFIADFQLEVPEAELEVSAKKKEILGLDIIDLDLIKINLSPALLIYCLRGIFLKRKIAIIIDQKYLYQQISNFFSYITQNSFNTTINLITKEDYNNFKEKFIPFLVIEGKELINNPENIPNSKKLFMEPKIIDQFLSESQSTLSLVLLKNEIKKVYELSKSIAEFTLSYKQKDKLSSKIITKYLIDAHGLKIEKDYKNYLNFLLEISDNYFGVKTTDRSNVTDVLEFIN
jgi:hypothetical protein